MEWTVKELLSPLLAIAGLIVGASAQYLFSRLTENRKAADKLRTDAYVDFVKGCAGVAMAQRFKDEAEHLKASALMLDAKVRMAIYGDSSVAQGVGQFFESYGDFSRRADKRAFVDVISQMRQRVAGSSNEADRAAISQILFSEVVDD